MTAELALGMPALLMVVSLLISGLVLGVQRVQVAYAAGTLARAVSRGEDISSAATSLGVQATVSYQDEFVCATAVAKTWLMDLEQKSCALKLGL